jgi:Cu/Ag efflux protein CusF
MRRARRPLAAMAAALALCSAAAAQEADPQGWWRSSSLDAKKGVFHARGIVKAVDPGNGAVTLAHDAIEGLKPAMETVYRVQAPGLIKSLRPGDTVDFSIDASNFSIDALEEVIIGVSLLNYDQ